MDEQQNDSQKKPSGNGYWYSRVIPGTYLVLVGLIFLLNDFGYFRGDAWGKLWPLFIIVPGLFMIFRPRKW